MSTHENSQQDDGDERRQIKDAPLRRSEEDADTDNPDVGQPDVSEESEESFETWERNETEE